MKYLLLTLVSGLLLFSADSVFAKDLNITYQELPAPKVYVGGVSSIQVGEVYNGFSTLGCVKYPFVPECRSQVNRGQDENGRSFYQPKRPVVYRAK